MIVIKGRKPMEYEKVVVDDWLTGKIDEVQFRVNENRKYQDKETKEWLTKKVDEVRFAFTFEGYQYRHYSRWMTASMNEKSNLYAKYLKEIVPDLEPETDIDLEGLKGKQVKIMWKNDKGKDGNIYQSVAQIRGVDVVSKNDLVLPEDETGADGVL